MKLLALTAFPLALTVCGVWDPFAGLPADLALLVGALLIGVPVGVSLVWIGRWSRG